MNLTTGSGINTSPKYGVLFSRVLRRVATKLFRISNRLTCSLAGLVPRATPRSCQKILEVLRSEVELAPKLLSKLIAHHSDAVMKSAGVWTTVLSEAQLPDTFSGIRDFHAVCTCKDGKWSRPGQSRKHLAARRALRGTPSSPIKRLAMFSRLRRYTGCLVLPFTEPEARSRAQGGTYHVLGLGDLSRPHKAFAYEVLKAGWAKKRSRAHQRQALAHVQNKSSCRYDRSA